jgi:phosphatidylserine/phosphatidylglycerophosphate/cardiolipin synthase-like enzyme
VKLVLATRPPRPWIGWKSLSGSARGWHTIQMAVLGFIGICGILRTASSPAPRAVQWLAAALAVAALAAACAAIFTVGRVAYPVSDDTDGASAVPGAAARLRAGIRLTIVALILAVIARPAPPLLSRSPPPAARPGAARSSAGEPVLSVEVKIIMSEFEKAGYLEQLQGMGLDTVNNVKIQNNVHNKGIIVDGSAVLVSSQNWSSDGTLYNRDAGVILYNETAAQYFQQIFLHDCDHLAIQKAQSD